jgi:hypothetical protein
MKHIGRLAVLGLGLILLTLAGCSEKPRPRIQGKVTYKGTPLAGRSLALHAEGDSAVQKFPIQADGGFSGLVTAPGTYRVAIEEPLTTSEGGQPADGKRVKLPSKYAEPQTSGLEWTIEPGDNPRDFALPE